jgi:hypothetical protein
VFRVGDLWPSFRPKLTRFCCCYLFFLFIFVRSQTGFDFSHPSSKIGSASKGRREARRQYGRTRGESMFNELDNADLTSANSRKRLASIHSVSSSNDEGGEAKTGSGPRRESDPELERRKSLRVVTGMSSESPTV